MIEIEVKDGKVVAGGLSSEFNWMVTSKTPFNNSPDKKRNVV